MGIFPKELEFFAWVKVEKTDHNPIKHLFMDGV
jgi:hypothetical protein